MFLGTLTLPAGLLRWGFRCGTDLTRRGCVLEEGFEAGAHLFHFLRLRSGEVLRLTDVFGEVVEFYFGRSFVAVGSDFLGVPNTDNPNSPCLSVFADGHLRWHGPGQQDGVVRRLRTLCEHRPHIEAVRRKLLLE